MISAKGMSRGILILSSALLSAIAFLALSSHFTTDSAFELESHSAAASVGEQDLAHSILSSAKHDFLQRKSQPAEAKQKKIREIDGIHLDKQASAVANSKTVHKTTTNAPDSSLLKRMPAYLAQRKKDSSLKSKESARQKLEDKIAAHKLTTRGLVKAVQQAEAAHFKELNQDLKDQTDDLIIAKINEITRKHKGGVNNYVLNNALTPHERKELTLSKEGKGRAMATAHRRMAAHARLQQKNPAILKSTGGAKGGDTESMLSSYDRELLEKGPSSFDSSPAPAPAALSNTPPGYMPPGAAPMLTQMPSPQYSYYPQPAYGYAVAPAPYTALAAGYSQPPPQAYSGAYSAYPAAAARGPYQYPYPPAQQQYGYPSLQQRPYSPPQGPPMYPAGEAPYSSPPQQQQLYPSPYARYPAPVPPAYAAAPAGYISPPQTLAEYTPQQSYGAPPYAAAGGYYMPPAAAAPAVEMTQRSASFAVPRPPAAEGTGGGGEGGGGGRLWKLFSSPSGGGGSSGMPPPLGEGDGMQSAGGGFGDSGEEAPASIVHPPRSSMKAAPAAGGGMAAQMEALRASILADYRSTIHIGRKAGYLPPPP